MAAHLLNRPLCFADKVEEMTHAQKSSPVDMKIATIKPRPSSRCLVTQADINVSDTFGPEKSFHMFTLC